jgi:hypothetical protein
MAGSAPRLRSTAGRAIVAPMRSVASLVARETFGGIATPECRLFDFTQVAYPRLSEKV